MGLSLNKHASQHNFDVLLWIFSKKDQNPVGESLIFWSYKKKKG